ncbi:MAG TPA: TraR/DksA C4-type zinc finger protein [Candidatus Binatia bacterium]|nr:TraR/DksA C4-type zinc finger protein [Candidatus Binatia bacterium]
MDRNDLDSFAESLRKQRKRYLDQFRGAERDLDSIAEERESELEEHAQEEQSARLLARMDDRTLHAVKEIDAALQRVLKGNYSICEACGQSVAVTRLRALPATRYCADCAGQYERPSVTPAAETVSLSTVPVPEDLSGLDDTELAEVIREHLKEDGRIDTQELRILCRRGVVHLSGALPSEAERQILLETVTDVLGLKEVVDRIQVEELLWERESRTKEKPTEVLAPGQEPAGTEDIVESSEEGKEFIAPAEPTPKEE